MNVAGLWDQLVLAVCRPPRDLYDGDSDLVGARRASFRLGHGPGSVKKYYRQDVMLENSRGLKLQASHYRPCVVTSMDGRLPCVIYCHCNSGSRRDAEEILYHMLPKSITVFALDFSGSGLSEGSYVTLGALEVDDLATAVQYLRDEGSTSTIALWGRSMGAVTALLYCQRDPSIAGMVLDSPFSRLSDLMMELATDQQLRIPKPFIKVALAMMRRSVRKRAGFSIEDVSPLDKASECFVPALFGHAREDTFVNKHHSERLFAAHAGDKNFITFDGDHNSVRPDFFYDSALIFLLHALRVQELVGPDVDLHSIEDTQLPHMISRGNSIYITSHSHPASPTAAEASEAASSMPPSPTLQRTLSPPWDTAALPGHSRRPSHDSHEFDAAVAQATAALAAERQQHGGAPHSPAPAGGARAQSGVVPSLFSGEALGALAPGGAANGMWGADGEEHLQSIDEEAALQQALELSLRDMQQTQQPQQDADAALPEQRRYNPLYSSSGPQNPLNGRSTESEAPHSREDEEAMLAQAIAESLRLQNSEPVPQQPQQPEPALLPETWREAVRRPSAFAFQIGSPVQHAVASAELTHSPQSSPSAAAAQDSVAQHSQQEAAVAHAASTELQRAFSGAVAAAAAANTEGGSGSASSSSNSSGRGATGSVGFTADQGATAAVVSAAGGAKGAGGPGLQSGGQGDKATQVDEEAGLQRLREQAAGWAGTGVS